MGRGQREDGMGKRGTPRVLSGSRGGVEEGCGAGQQNRMIFWRVSATISLCLLYLSLTCQIRASQSIIATTAYTVYACAILREALSTLYAIYRACIRVRDGRGLSWSSCIGVSQLGLLIVCMFATSRAA